MSKILKIIAVLLLLFTTYAAWYYLQYSMDFAPEFELNDIANHKKIIIATQGSEFKDELTLKVVKDPTFASCYFKVVDVSRLHEIDINAWDAILVIHTWENWEPPAVVGDFVQLNITSKKLVVYTTSGSEDSTLPDIDGITGASIMENVEKDKGKIIAKLSSIISPKE